MRFLNRDFSPVRMEQDRQRRRRCLGNAHGQSDCATLRSDLLRTDCGLGSPEQCCQLTQMPESRCANLGGAKGNRTPDLLDANESRYQLRHSP